MINFSNEKGYSVTRGEFDEALVTLISLCNLNPKSEQASKMKWVLEDFEEAVAAGAFKN